MSSAFNNYNLPRFGNEDESQRNYLSKLLAEIYTRLASGELVTNFGSGTSAAPTGNVSTTAKMMGLGLVTGFSITPRKTGNVAVWIAGVALNSTAVGDGTSITGKFGTGTAPSNGAADAGTVFGLQQHFIASTTAGQQGFCCLGKAAVTAGVPTWFDLSVVAVTGGGASVKDCQCLLIEM